MPATVDHGVLDIRRKHQIAEHKAQDYYGEVIVVPSSTFDLNSTIFGSLEGALPRTVVKSKIGVELFWKDKAIQRINAQYEKIPRCPEFPNKLVDFMQNECDFAMEHADGSFMDHLRFCFEYCHANFKEKSAVPLLLHSIMGVGTNFFPMKAEKIPQLKQLCTDEEFKHVEAFPSILRLIVHQELLLELIEKMDNLDSLKSITMHRVIDNGEITLQAEDLWTALNYQLCHLLDFLPASSWYSQLDDGLFDAFIKLHKILSTSGKQVAQVDFDMTGAAKSTDNHSSTLGSFLRSVLPTAVSLKLSKKAIATFSQKINHVISYTIDWGEGQVE
jgi:hypothetical protein